MEFFDGIGGVPLAPGVLPANPYAYRAGRSPLYESLAFLFVPSPAGGYTDLVRRDRAALGGIYSSSATKFGTAYVLGTAAGAVSGYAATAPQAYYQPPKAGMSMAMGLYNQTAIGNTTCYLASWRDATLNNGFLFKIYDNAGEPQIECDVFVAGTKYNAQPTTGAPNPPDQAGQYFGVGATYGGGTLTAAWWDNIDGGGNTNTAGSGFPSGVTTVTLSDNLTTNCAGRTILWLAGWFRSLSLTEIETVVNYGYTSGTPSAGLVGGLPPRILQRR